VGVACFLDVLVSLVSGSTFMYAAALIPTYSNQPIKPAYITR
jgi:hypothetical protein